MFHATSRREAVTSELIADFRGAGRSITKLLSNAADLIEAVIGLEVDK